MSKTPISFPSNDAMPSFAGIAFGDNFNRDFMPPKKIAEIEICPHCFGCGMETVAGKGARPCRCRRHKARENLVNAIPPKIKRFGVPELKKFQPRKDLHPNEKIAGFIFDEQVRILAKIRKNPFANFYLAGLNGCGKTTIAYALALNSFDAGRKCVAITLSDLLEEFRLYSNSSGEDKQRNKPSILPEALQQNHELYSILIDEVGSPKASEYRGEMFFNLLNAIQNFGHQLIVTSNKTDRAFVEKWSQFDDTHGESIARRLSENAAAMRCFLTQKS